MNDQNSNHVEKISFAAANWLVREDELNTNPILQAELNQWCKADPRHLKAYQEMQALWQAGVIKENKPSVTSKYAPWAALCLILSIYQPITTWLKTDHYTSTGDVKTVYLNDGSTLTLNSNSAVSIDVNQEQRTVYLLQGEVFVNVAKDPAGRKFVIKSEHGQSTALGTQYIVHNGDNYDTLQVLESKVSLRVSKQHKVLNSDQQTQFNKHGIKAVKPLKFGAGSWRNHKIMFNEQPLRDVFSQLIRYKKGYLYIDDTVDQQQLFTGILPTNNIKLALDTVAHSFNLSIKHNGSWLTRIDTKPQHQQ